MNNRVATASRGQLPSSKRNQRNTDGQLLPAWVYCLDVCILSLIPVLSCIDLVSSGRLSRSYFSILLLFMISLKAVLFPAISFAYAKAFKRAVAHLLAFKDGLWVILSIYILVLTVAHIRGIYSSMMPFGAFLGFLMWSTSIFLYIYFTIAVESSERRRRVLVGAFFAGLIIYVLSNFIAYLAGFHGAVSESDYGASRLLSAIGLHSSRLSFPISAGPTAFGPIAGMLGTLGLYFLFAGTNTLRRFIGLLALISGVAGVFLVDSRSALVCMPVSLLLAVVFVRSARFRPVFRAATIFIPVFPFLLIGLVKLVDSLGIASILQRDTLFAQKLGVASGRDDIWASVLSVLRNFDPMQLVGYGAYGQMGSGVSKEYSWIFSQAGSTSASAHNAALQVLLDTGYIGLVVWIVLIYKYLKSIDLFIGLPRMGIQAISFAIMIMYFILSGFFDVSTTFYQSDTFPVFLGLIAIMVGYRFLIGRSEEFSGSKVKNNPNHMLLAPTR